MVKCEMCEEEAIMYRKLDYNPRPLCKEHFEGVGTDNFAKMMIQRHYFKIGDD